MRAVKAGRAARTPQCSSSTASIAAGALVLASTQPRTPPNNVQKFCGQRATPGSRTIELPALSVSTSCSTVAKHLAPASVNEAEHGVGTSGAQISIALVNGQIVDVEVEQSTLVENLMQRLQEACQNKPCYILLGDSVLQPSDNVLDVLHEHGVTSEEVVLAAFVKTPKQLKAEGYTAFQILYHASSQELKLKADSYTAFRRLRRLSYPLDMLRDAGYTAQELRKIGYVSSPNAFRDAGYTASELKAAGYLAKELANVGYTLAELKAAGYTLAELKAAGYTLRLGQICSNLFLLKDLGFTTKELKRFGHSLSALMEAGFEVMELKEAGFTAQNFTEAGVSLTELKDAGFTAGDMAKAGYSPLCLMTASYTIGEIQQAGYSAQQLQESGCTSWEISAIIGPQHV